MKLKNFNLTIGSQTFKACADESRLPILHPIFENSETCISAPDRILEFSQVKTARLLILLRDSGMLLFRRYNHSVFDQVKDEVYEIVNQILQYLREHHQLQRDLQLYKALYPNRELSVIKGRIEDWQKKGS